MKKIKLKLICYLTFELQEGRKSQKSIKSLLINENDEDVPDLPALQVMANVTISLIKPISAGRIRERMAIENMDFTVAMDYQNFEAIMQVFQTYFEKAKEDADADFPEAQLLQRFGSPGAQRSWWQTYHWLVLLIFTS